MNLNKEISEKTTIILLSYKGAKDTIECVNSLKHLKDTNFNIIIVDNNSPDDTVNQIICELNKKNFDYGVVEYDYDLKEFDKNCINEIIIIKNNKNTGFASGNNIGIIYNRKILNNNLVWILNNDTVVDEDNLYWMNKKLKEYNYNAMIGSTIIEYYDREKIQIICGNKYYGLFSTKKTFFKGINIDQINNITPKFDYIAGCSVYTSDNVLKSIEDFTDKYFLYYEDVDLSMKARKKNIPLVWCKNSLVFHKHGASIGGKNIISKKNTFSEYQSNYNALVYNHIWFKKIHFIPDFNRYIIKFIYIILKRQFYLIKPLNKAYLDYYRKEK